jgi:hypothetical protein
LFYSFLSLGILRAGGLVVLVMLTDQRLEEEYLGEEKIFLFTRQVDARFCASAHCLNVCQFSFCLVSFSFFLFFLRQYYCICKNIGLYFDLCSLLSHMVPGNLNFVGDMEIGKRSVCKK